jgi:hypothetical protein
VTGTNCRNVSEGYKVKDAICMKIIISLMVTLAIEQKE